MSKKTKFGHVAFHENTLEYFKGNEDPSYKIFEATRKLLRESKNAIDILGEFVEESNEFNNPLSSIDIDFYDPKQFEELTSDLSMLEGMLDSLIKKRDKKNFHISITGMSNDKVTMIYNTKKINKSIVVS